MYIARFIESVGVQAMKRTEIKRRPLSDTVLATLEPESKEYRELDGNGLYFRVKPDGKKAWLFRYKKASNDALNVCSMLVRIRRNCRCNWFIFIIDHRHAHGAAFTP